MISTCSWSRAQLAINKMQKKLSLPDHQLAENLILVFGIYGMKAKRSRKICKWFFRNYNYNYSHIKMHLKLPVKLLLYSSFSLFTWNTNPLGETLFFEVFRIFCFIWQSFLDQTLFFFLFSFCESKVNKTIWLVLSQHSNIITTVILQRPCFVK